MVERNLPKVDVAGSSPVIRSTAARSFGLLYYMIRRMYMKYTYVPRGVCSRMIEFETEDGVIKSCRFIGGCHGNLQGISALVKGMKVTDAIDKLEGINCGGRGTSCPDQLSKALKSSL